ncbi:MAG: FtsX-like permease family protein [Thermoanaerobaculia bacterium]
MEKVRAMPGVREAATIYPLPLGDSNMVLAFTVEGRPAPPPNEVPSANVRGVSPDYFRALGIGVRQGRTFTEQDVQGSLPVVVVNETMAKKVWAGDSPLGKRITFGDPAVPGDWVTVVGVVADVRHQALNEEPGSEAYWPQYQQPFTDFSLVVRTDRDPASLPDAVREAVRSLDSNLPVDQIRTMEDLVALSLSQSRFKMVLLSLFAGLALALAAVGVYGVVSYSVTQRTHEIGIRMALGAERRGVLRLVVRQGMIVVLIGVAAGLALAFWGSRFLAGQVYGVSAKDPLTFLAVPLVLLAVALIANYLPARRATRVDPLVALRQE